MTVDVSFRALMDDSVPKTSRSRSIKDDAKISAGLMSLPSLGRSSNALAHK